MKVGLSVGINVTKIDKERITVDKNGGKWINLTTFVDIDNVDQYDNNGFISQSISKEERSNGVQTPILGNVRVIYKDDQGSGPAPSKQQDLEEDVPF
jgi:hypothetical protein